MLAISATNYLHLLAMDKLNYPVKAVFIPGQREGHGGVALMDPLHNKKCNEANEKAIKRLRPYEGEGQ